MFLSSNNFFWKVTRKGQVLRRIQMWRKLGRPEASLVGVQWVAGNQGQSEKPYVASSVPPAYSWVYSGTGIAPGSTFGGSGVEIDARAPSSPASTVVLARIPGAIGSHDAEMAIYAASGARVFAAGTLDFTASLGSAQVAKLVDNVWNELSR
jgi:N,N-dimethylformamidase beta subunit-like protein